jgi:hypothetical protein
VKSVEIGLQEFDADISALADHAESVEINIAPVDRLIADVMSQRRILDHGQLLCPPRPKGGRSSSLSMAQHAFVHSPNPRKLAQSNLDLIEEGSHPQ